jgi:uncharacterized membrane protein
VSTYEWLLFLHILAAFLLVAGLVGYSVLVLSSGGEAVSRSLGPPALMLWNAGGLGTLVFGVWLALDVDGYELWDGWIIAALVLWLIGSGAAGRLGTALREGQSDARLDHARVMVGVMALATLLLLLDMIFKPGA